MKFTKGLMLFAFACLFMFSSNSYAQEEEKEEFSPVFLTITTMHRSSDPDTDFSDWMEVEKEFFDNVTMKNDLILGSGVYFHYFSPDDSEVIQVSVYKSWADIELAADKTGELINAHWTDKDARSEYFKKRNSYYDGNHSDEIMVSTPFGKELVTESTEPLIFYVKKNQQGNGGSGFKEYYENVTMKNAYIKGYYTHVHRYGSNSNDAHEVFVFENFSDIEKSFDEEDKLMKEHWPDEEKRKAFFKEYAKIFSGHGDFIYQNVPELAK